MTNNSTVKGSKRQTPQTHVSSMARIKHSSTKKDPHKKAVAAAKLPKTTTISKAKSSKKEELKATAKRPVKPTKASSLKKAEPKKEIRRSAAKIVEASSKKAAVKTAQEAPAKVTQPEQKKTSPATQKVTAAALKAFELAVKAFYRQDYPTARASFASLLDKYSSEVDIIARARTYITICEQRMERPKPLPRSLDALYSQGVFELNSGNVEKAVSLFEKAMRLNPEADYVIYSLASAQARLGDKKSALMNLRRSIELQPTHRIQARRDPDFSALYDSQEFQHLVGMSFESEARE